MRQIRKENKAKDGDECSEGEVPETRKKPKAISIPTKERKLHSTKELTSSVQNSHGNDKRDLADMSLNNKRKRKSTEGNDRIGKEPTHRRLVRELDSVTMDDQVLDYGDEPSTSREAIAKSEVKLQASISDLEDAPPQSSVGQKRPLEGKKIWWPILGT